MIEKEKRTKVQNEIEIYRRQLDVIGQGRTALGRLSVPMTDAPHVLNLIEFLRGYEGYAKGQISQRKAAIKDGSAEPVMDSGSPSAPAENQTGLVEGAP